MVCYVLCVVFVFFDHNWSDSVVFHLFVVYVCIIVMFYFFQEEDGIRDRSPFGGLGDVYKRKPAHGSGTRYRP